MKKTIGKLAVRRETLRVLRALGNTDLDRVVGGTLLVSDGGCPVPQRESKIDCQAPAAATTAAGG